MKITRLTLVSLCSLTFPCWAQPPAKNLWSEFERQQRWEDVRLESDGVQGTIKAVLAEGKQIRLVSIDGEFDSRGEMKSSLWGFFNTQETFKRDCDLMSGAIDIIRKKKNEFSVLMQTLPLNRAFYTVVHADGTREQLMGPANRIEPVRWLKIEMPVADGALVRKTKLDIDEVNYQLTGQLNNQRDQIHKTGVIHLDLTGYDDLACDILKKRVQIKVTVNSHYEKARLSRVPLFNTQEIDQLATSLGRRSQAPIDADARVLMPAFLSVELERMTRPIEKFAPWEFERLYGLLVDRVTGQPKAVPNAKLPEVAAQMDRLEQQMTFSSPVYVLNLDPRGN